MSLQARGALLCPPAPPPSDGTPLAPTFRKALPFLHATAQATSPCICTTASLLLKPIFPVFARMDFTQHSPHLSHSSAYKCAPENELQAARPGIRLHTQYRPTQRVLISPGPTCTLGSNQT